MRVPRASILDQETLLQLARDRTGESRLHALVLGLFCNYLQANHVVKRCFPTALEIKLLLIC